MVEDVLAALAQAANRHNLPYMVIGGQAVLAYGAFRVTHDVDVTLGVDPDRLDDVLTLAEEEGWQPMVSDPRDFVRRTWVLPCKDPGGLRVDLVFCHSPYERQAIERARDVQIGLATVRMTAPEDLVVQKLFAGRPRDIEDVAGILRRSPQLDLGYLRHWLAEFDAGLDRGMAAQFERLWADAQRP